MAARPRRGPLGDLARAAQAAWRSSYSRSFWTPLLGVLFALPLTVYSLQWDYSAARTDLLLFRLLVLGGLAISVFAASRLLFPRDTPAVVIGTYLVGGWLHWKLAQIGLDPLVNAQRHGPLRSIWDSAVSPFPLMSQWLVWMTFLTIIIVSATQVRALSWQVAGVERQLDELRVQSEVRSRRLRADWQRMVEQVLSPRVVQLRRMISDHPASAGQAGLAAAARAIQSFCRDQVRVMSHEFYERRPGADPQQGGARLSDVFQLGFRRPGVNLLYAYPLAMGGAFQFYVQRASLKVVGVSMLVVGTAILIGLLVVWATNSLRFERLGAVAAVSLVFISLQTAVTAVLLNWAAQAPGLTPEELVAARLIADSFPAALFLCGIGLLASLAWRHGMELFSAQLEDRQRQLADLRDEATAREQAIRRRLALLLHGSVQGKLAAAALALTLEESELAGADPVATAERLLDEVLLELHSVSADERDSGVGVAERLARIERDWEGILELGVELDATTAAWLDAQPHRVTAVEQLLQEAAANALRHGNARWLQGRVWLESGVLRAQLVSDSQPEPHQSPGGIGLDAIRSTGARVDFIEAPGRFTLEVAWA